MTHEEKTLLAGKWYIRAKEAKRDLDNYRSKAKDLAGVLETVCRALREEDTCKINENGVVEFISEKHSYRKNINRNDFPSIETIQETLSKFHDLQDELKEANENLDKIS